MAIVRRGAHPATHQTVELKRGRHSSPAKGACVVELASMLAEERFSDHPRSVCPVIACFMRTVNDSAPEEFLPELYPYASAIVGTRGPRAVRNRRVRLCASWSEQLDHRSSSFGRALAGWLGDREAAAVCARAALLHGGPSLALTLVDALIAVGAVERAHEWDPTAVSWRADSAFTSGAPGVSEMHAG